MGGSHSKTKEDNVHGVSITTKKENQTLYSNSPPTNQSPSQPISTSTQVNNTTDDMATSRNSSSVVEAVVAKVNDLENGQMKEVKVADKSVLLVKDKDQFYALGNRCTHFGAPLSKGSYCNGIVRCPFHGACFDVKTGDIEDYPGLDSVHSFDVEVKGDEVIIRADVAKLEEKKRVKATVRKHKENKETALLVGGGIASVVCAQTLREEGFTGQITIVSKEPHLPYDRIQLSKAMKNKAEDIALRSKEYYVSNGIDFLLGKEMTSLNASDSSITLSDSQTLSYNHLLLATGGEPRCLPVPGVDLQNVYVLRTIEMANAIDASASDTNIVIIGTSFIALEVASYLSDKAASVNVVGLRPPLSPQFGHWVGSFVTQMHTSKGVKFHIGTSVKEFKGEDGKVKEAVLENGETLAADVVLMGIGVVPATKFLKGSGLEMTDVGYLSVNKRMETNIPNVYGAGDIVEFPLAIEGDKAINIQHLQMAHKHGKVAGLSIVGKHQDVKSVPYFWTRQYGRSLHYCGYGNNYDDVELRCHESGDQFVAFYIRSNQVVAVASMIGVPIVPKIADLMNSGKEISRKDIDLDPILSWLPTT